MGEVIDKSRGIYSRIFIYMGGTKEDRCITVTKVPENIIRIINRLTQVFQVNLQRRTAHIGTRINDDNWRCRKPINGIDSFISATNRIGYDVLYVVCTRVLVLGF